MKCAKKINSIFPTIYSVISKHFLAKKNSVVLRISDFDCAFMIVSIENHKMALTSIKLTSIALWFTLKERPLQFTFNTILFNRAEVATSVDNLAIKFEL